MSEIKNELGNKSHEKLKQYYEAIERYEEEKKELTERIKEIYDAAKNEGFDSKIIKKLLKLSREDKEKRQEEQYEEQEQEPNAVPCFRCDDTMYEIAEDPKDNICESCKQPSGVMLDTWGKYLALPRERGESDDLYKKRLSNLLSKKPKTLKEAIKESGIEVYMIKEKGRNGDIIVTTSNKEDDKVMKDIFYNYARISDYRSCDFKISPSHNFKR